MERNFTRSEYFRAWLVLLATLATIVFGVLGTLGVVNGASMAGIVDHYPTILSPSIYGLTIWYLVYAGMLAFAIYQLLPANVARYKHTRAVYLIICVLHCGWIYTFHLEWFGGALVVTVVWIAALAVICYKLREPASLRESIYTKTPFGIYFGWVACVLIIELALCSKYGGWNFNEVDLGVVSLVLVAVTALIVRWRLTNYVFPLSAAWGLTAISIRQSGNTPIVLAAALATVACFVISGTIVTSLKDSTSERL